MALAGRTRLPELVGQYLVPVVSAPKTESGAGRPYNLATLRTPIHKHFVGMLIENAVTHLLVECIGIGKCLANHFVIR